MAEMAVTADRLVIVGRGRLIADVAITDLTDRATIKSVSVRTAHPGRLRGLLAGAGVTITTGESGELDVIGLTAEQIGAHAATAGIVLHELTPIRASLEDVFMDLTRDAVEYHGTASTPLAA